MSHFFSSVSFVLTIFTDYITLTCSFKYLSFTAFIAEKIPKPTYPGEPVNSNVGMCGYPTCMTALAVNLGIVLAANIAVNNTVGIILPLVSIDFEICVNCELIIR